MASSEPVLAYVALGANLGDRESNLRAALSLLEEGDISIARVSSFIENPAVGGPPDSPPFVNAVAEVRTTLSPQRLLDRLLEIERQLGRQRREKWGPRSIDLDLILYGDRIIQTPTLTIPHPRMHERRFVLQPLAELAPHLVHPVLKQQIAQMLNALQS